MPPKPKDPLTLLFEALSPVIAGLVDYLRVLVLMPETVKRIVKAVEEKEGIELSADEAKALVILLSQLSSAKK